MATANINTDDKNEIIIYITSDVSNYVIGIMTVQ